LILFIYKGLYGLIHIIINDEFVDDFAASATITHQSLQSRRAVATFRLTILDPNDRANPEALAIVARVDRIATDADPFG
jgi:hypothetical protein